MKINDQEILAYNSCLYNRPCISESVFPPKTAMIRIRWSTPECGDVILKQSQSDHGRSALKCEAIINMSMGGTSFYTHTQAHAKNKTNK